VTDWTVLDERVTIPVVVEADVPLTHQLMSKTLFAAGGRIALLQLRERGLFRKVTS